MERFRLAVTGLDGFCRLRRALKEEARGAAMMAALWNWKEEGKLGRLSMMQRTAGEFLVDTMERLRGQERLNEW